MRVHVDGYHQPHNYPRAEHLVSESECVRRIILWSDIPTLGSIEERHAHHDCNSVDSLSSTAVIQNYSMLLSYPGTGNPKSIGFVEGAGIAAIVRMALPNNWVHREKLRTRR